ncbi:MAG TPA: antibiotic biosynthesis monooxygenase [Candidatus Sulfotelmatobacter sp.]|nr:antibiotic biosynthesis monooxygenase [Candidatus Sulfotelmatobacter sp.]
MGRHPGTAAAFPGGADADGSGQSRPSCHRDRADRDLFVFYEVWSIRDALLAHLERPYVTDFLKDRHRYLEEDLEIRWLRMSSPHS